MNVQGEIPRLGGGGIDLRGKKGGVTGRPTGPNAGGDTRRGNRLPPERPDSSGRSVRRG